LREAVQPLALNSNYGFKDNVETFICNPNIIGCLLKRTELRLMSEIEVPNPKELEELKEKHFSRRVALVTAVYAVLTERSSAMSREARSEYEMLASMSGKEAGRYAVWI
jgi:hypothetical protein